MRHSGRKFSVLVDLVTADLYSMFGSHVLRRVAMIHVHQQCTKTIFLCCRGVAIAIVFQLSKADCCKDNINMDRCVHTCR